LLNSHLGSPDIFPQSLALLSTVNTILPGQFPLTG
jgi:hypothetical protein